MCNCHNNSQIKKELTNNIECDGLICIWEERFLIERHERKIVVMVEFVDNSWIWKWLIFVVDEPACDVPSKIFRENVE